MRKLFTLSLAFIFAAIVLAVVFSYSSVAYAEEVDLVYPGSGYIQTERVDVLGANDNYILSVDNKNHSLLVTGAKYAKLPLSENILKVLVFGDNAVLTSPTTNYFLDLATMQVSTTDIFADCYIATDGTNLYAHHYGEVKVYGNGLNLISTCTNDIFKNRPVLATDGNTIYSFAVDYGINKLYTYNVADGTTNSFGSVFVESAYAGDVIYAYDGEKIILINKGDFTITSTEITDKNFFATGNTLYVAKGEKGYDKYNLVDGNLVFHSNVSYTGDSLDKLNGAKDVVKFGDETVVADTLNNRILFVGTTTVSLAINEPSRLAVSQNRLYVLSGNELLVIEDKTVKNRIETNLDVKDMFYNDRLYILTENGVYTLISGSLIKVFDLQSAVAFDFSTHIFVASNNGVDVFNLNGEKQEILSFSLTGYTPLDIIVDKAGNVFILGDDNQVHVYDFADVIAVNTGVVGSTYEGTPITLDSTKYSFTANTMNVVGDKVYVTTNENAIVSISNFTTTSIQDSALPSLNGLSAEVYLTTADTYFMSNENAGITAIKVSADKIVAYDDGSATAGYITKINGKVGWVFNVTQSIPTTDVAGEYKAKENLTLYTNPLFDSDVTISKGATLSVIDDACGFEDGKWLRVNYNGKIYFVLKDKVQKATSLPTIPGLNDKPHEEVKVHYGRAKASRVGEFVNLYSDANGTTVVASVKDSTKLEIVEKVGDYYKVVYEGAEVYIHESEFKLDGLTTVQIVAIVLSVVVVLAGSLVFAVTSLARKKEETK